jgi:hypothetical protein
MSCHRALPFLFCSALLCMASARLFGAEVASLPRYEAGAYLGGHTSSDQTEGGFIGLIQGRLNFNDFLSLSLQGGFMPLRAKNGALDSRSIDTFFGELVPRLYITPPVEEKYGGWLPRLYLQMGAGFYNTAVYSNPNVVPEPDLKNAFGWISGGGLDYQITADTSVGVDIAFVTLRPTLDVGSASDKLNLDSLRALVGFHHKIF